MKFLWSVDIMKHFFMAVVHNIVVIKKMFVVILGGLHAKIFNKNPKANFPSIAFYRIHHIQLPFQLNRERVRIFI